MTIDSRVTATPILPMLLSRSARTAEGFGTQFDQLTKGLKPSR